MSELSVTCYNNKLTTEKIKLISRKYKLPHQLSVQMYYVCNNISAAQLRCHSCHLQTIFTNI